MYKCLKETVGAKGIRLTPRDLRYSTGTTRNGLQCVQVWVTHAMVYNLVL